jgi:hypothetical protein
LTLCGSAAATITFWFFAFPIGFMTGSFISGRIDAERSIEFMTILGRIRARTLLFYGGAGHVDFENTRYTAWAPSSKR